MHRLRHTRDRPKAGCCEIRRPGAFVRIRARGMQAMERRGVPGTWVAGCALTAMLLAVTLDSHANPTDAAAPAAKSRADGPGRELQADFRHGSVVPLRHPDGTLRLGFSNEVETSNWSGYAVANYATGVVYSRAKASWTVPKVSFVAPQSACQVTRIGQASTETCHARSVSTEYSVTWVGIGGYCNDANCTSVDRTLIQLGTAQIVGARGGSSQYYAWYEMLPDFPITITSRNGTCGSATCPNVVKPGDAITASLVCTANCVPGETQTWVLSMTNRAQHWTWSTTVHYASSMLAADWIQEAPYGAGVLPLANYGTVTFVPAVNGNSPPNFASAGPGSTSPDAILMVDPFGETSNPSIPEVKPTLDAFSTCWGNNPNQIALCPTP